MSEKLTSWSTLTPCCAEGFPPPSSNDEVSDDSWDHSRGFFSATVFPVSPSPADFRLPLLLQLASVDSGHVFLALSVFRPSDSEDTVKLEIVLSGSECPSCCARFSSSISRCFSFTSFLALSSASSFSLLTCFRCFTYSAQLQQVHKNENDEKYLVRQSKNDWKYKNPVRSLTKQGCEICS